MHRYCVSFEYSTVYGVGISRPLGSGQDLALEARGCISSQKARKTRAGGESVGRTWWGDRIIWRDWLELLWNRGVGHCVGHPENELFTALSNVCKLLVFRVSHRLLASQNSLSWFYLCICSCATTTAIAFVVANTFPPAPIIQRALSAVSSVNNVEQ